MSAWVNLAAMAKTASERERARVWLVEDNGEYRRSLARVLDRTPGLVCAQACGSCEEAFERLALQPAPQAT